MKPSIRLTKQVGAHQEDTSERSWPLIVTAQAIGMPAEVFVYQRGHQTLDPGQLDTFSCIAGPRQLEEIPAGPVGHGGPFYRSAKVEFICDSPAERTVLWKEIQRQVQILVRDYGDQQDLIAQEVVTIGTPDSVDFAPGWASYFRAIGKVFFLGQGGLYYQLASQLTTGAVRTLALDQTGPPPEDLAGMTPPPTLIKRPLYLRGQDGMLYQVTIVQDDQGVRSIGIDQVGKSIDDLPPIMLEQLLLTSGQDNLGYGISLVDQAGTKALNVAQYGIA